MKHVFLHIILATFMLCPNIQAHSWQEGESPVYKILDSQKESKKIDGAMLKFARPFLKRTPMGVIIDEIHMMIICPMELDPQEEKFKFTVATNEVLGRYNMVEKIDDEKSTMTIYIDTPQDNKFSEIILYNTKPEGCIMLFVGDFTVESLIKVGEVSEQQRKNLKKNN